MDSKKLKLVMNTYNNQAGKIDHKKRKLSLIAKRVDYKLGDFKREEYVLDVGCAHPITTIKIAKE